MDSKNVDLHRVNAVIARVFQLDQDKIHLEMTPDDVSSWDSLGQLVLINNLEQEFDVIFEIEEMFEITKVDDIYRILKRKKAS